MKHSRFYVGMLVVLIILVVVFGRKYFSNAMAELKEYKQLIKTENVVQSDLQQNEIPDIDKIPDSVNLLEITVSCKNVSDFATALESYKPLNVVAYPQNKQVTFCCLITDGGAAND